MISGQIFEQRQIFTAKVDFSDGSGAKERPVVIISNNNHNKSNQDLICCPITSQLSGRGRVIYPKDYEVNTATLEIPDSEIKTQYPIILHKSRLYPLKTGRVKINKQLAQKIVDDINDAIKS